MEYNDIALVEKAVTLGYRDQDSCNAWERIKKFIEVHAAQSGGTPVQQLKDDQKCDGCEHEKSRYLFGTICSRCGVLKQIDRIRRNGIEAEMDREPPSPLPEDSIDFDESNYHGE